MVLLGIAPGFPFNTVSRNWLLNSQKMFVQFDLFWKMVAKVCHDAIECLKVSHCMHFRVGLELIDRTAFSTSFQAVGGTWIHMVLNYIGPENGQGTPDPLHPGDGTVVAGKVLGDYTSVAIDELLFFNIKLSDTQIRELLWFPLN